MHLQLWEVVINSLFFKKFRVCGVLLIMCHIGARLQPVAGDRERLESETGESMACVATFLHHEWRPACRGAYLRPPRLLRRGLCAPSKPRHSSSRDHIQQVNTTSYNKNRTTMFHTLCGNIYDIERRFERKKNICNRLHRRMCICSEQSSQPFQTLAYSVQSSNTEEANLKVF